MKKLKAILNESGLSLLDAVISAALFGIAFIGVSMQQDAQTRSQASISRQSLGMRVIHTVMDQYTTSPSTFPAIATGSSPLTFVGCFTENGAQENNQLTGNLSYSVHLLTTPEQFLTPVGVQGYDSMMACKPRLGGVEVHVSADSSDPTRLKIATVPLDMKIGSKMHKATTSSVQVEFKPAPQPSGTPTPVTAPTNISASPIPYS